MMFEKKLGKLGMSRAVLMGILFMILVLGILVSVKMVIAPEGGGDSTDLNKWNMEDKYKPETWKNYHKSITNTLLPDELSASPEQTQELWNSGKLTPEQKQGFLEEKYSYAEEYNLDILDGSTYDYSNNQLTTADGQTIDLGSFEEGTQVAESPGGGTEVTDPSGSRVAAEGSCGMNGGGGGGGGGGSGGEGGQGGTPKADAALQAASQALGYVNSLQLNADKFKKQVNPPVLFVPDAYIAMSGQGDVNVDVKDGGSTKVSDTEDKTVLLAQNDITLPGNIRGTNLKSFNTENSVIIVDPVSTQASSPIAISMFLPLVSAAETSKLKYYNAILITPPYKTTHVINDLAKNDPPLTNKPASSSIGGIISFVLPFFKLIGLFDVDKSVTGNAIIASPGQEIKLKDYDLGLSGEDLIVLISKPFDKLNAQGIDLYVLDGKTFISFNNLKTNYPRLVLENDYFINEIKNDYDTKNVFMLVPGGAKGNYFQDARYRLTVGDAVVKNPLEGYENIMIPATRLGMWKKAASGDIID